MFEFLKTCFCCCTLIALKVHQVSRCVVDTIKCLNDAWCCLPCNAVMAIKDCYDHSTCRVGIDTHTTDIEMVGVAPPEITMS